jgi:hypothetical protein
MPLLVLTQLCAAAAAAALEQALETCKLTTRVPAVNAG